jgi:hypothetical protein
MQDFLTIKYGFGFDDSLRECPFFAFSKQNCSCELIATSKIDLLVTTPIYLKMFEQVRFEYMIAPKIRIKRQQRFRTDDL